MLCGSFLFLIHITPNNALRYFKIVLQVATNFSNRTAKVQSPSSFSAFRSSSSSKSNNDVSLKLQQTSNLQSYKWKKTSSSSDIKQYSFNLNKNNFTDFSSRSSAIPKSMSLPVLNKNNYAWKNPECVRSKFVDSSSKKTLLPDKKLSAVDSPHVWSVPTTSSKLSKIRTNSRSCGTVEKNKSRFKWNKDTQSLPNLKSTSTLVISSPSLKKLLVAKVLSPNSKFRYVKRFVKSYQ